VAYIFGRKWLGPMLHRRLHGIPDEVQSDLLAQLEGQP